MFDGGKREPAAMSRFKETTKGGRRLIRRVGTGNGKKGSQACCSIAGVAALGS